MKERLTQTTAFRSVDVDCFVREPEGDNRLARMCVFERDRTALLSVIYRLYERAAKLVCINLTAVMEEAGLGKDPEHPALIAAEGSSFWKSSLFRPMLSGFMKVFTETERGISYRITQVPDANLIGSAAAALLNA